MNQALIANVPPFSSIQIQHVEGGFLCVVPPAAPVGAKLSGDVAAAMHIFLGAADGPSDKSSAAQTAALDEERPVLFEWPPYTCPQGSVFQASKIGRIDGRAGKNLSYMLTHHVAMPGSVQQAVLFDRGTVMERLKSWLTYAPPSEASRVSSLTTLSGMRPNAELSPDEDGVFCVQVTHASRVDGGTGMAPYVAASQEPRFVIGVVDADVLNHIVEALSGDLSGEFAARISEGWLEFGPRIAFLDE